MTWFKIVRNTMNTNFRDLLWASLAPGAFSRSTSLIISSHLNVLTNLIGGQGLEFQPYDDPFGDRLKCLQKIINQIAFQNYLTDIIHKLIATGEVLVWLRLTESGYRIRYYHAEEFIPYFKPDSDDLSAAIIRYEAYQGDQIKKYRVLVDKDGYYTSEDKGGTSPYSMVPGASGSWSEIDTSDYTYNPHPVPFFPLYLLRNRPTGPGSRSMGDFTGLEEDIVQHHAVHRAVSRNVKRYARQTVLTNLQRSDLLKPSDSGIGKNLPSYRAGYRPIDLGGSPAEEEIAEYIGVDGMAGESFIQPIDWNPINGDQLTYLDRWSEQLFSSLSSVAKVGGNTAFETRAMLAIPLAAANRKSELLFTRGFCLLLSDCLAYEASLYRCADVPDRSVTWRRIDLVEPTTRDQLDISILSRNLAEQGVGDSELLKLQFPGRTVQDIKRITGGSGGIPFRKIDKTVPAVQQLLQLAATVVDPGTQARLYNLASSLVSSLEESLNYGRSQYADPGYTAGIPYSGYQSIEPEPKPVASSGTELGEFGSPVNSLPTPGTNPPSPSNPIRDFFRGIWRTNRSGPTGMG